MSFQPRPYQAEARKSCHNEWQTVTATAAVLPTGTGKTVLFATIIPDFAPKRAMVIAHREELIWQAKEKIEKLTGLICGVEMGDFYVNNSLFGEMPVVISTVQTQTSKMGDRRRMGRFNPQDFGLLIIDECHHSTAQTYKDVINYYRQNPNLKVLGVTATPDRTDEEALGQIFDTVAFDYEILDAIHDGWLVPIEQQFVAISGLDFSSVRTTAGDLNGADLASVMESEKIMQGVCAASVDIIGKKRAIVFTCSVKQAEQGAEIFNRYHDGMARWVCGATNKDERRQLLIDFKAGKVQVIFNCGVLTEGFDDDGVEVVVMARPTKSRSLYAQMAGRGTRPLAGIVDAQPTNELRKAAIAASTKPRCLILDFVGNSGKHKLMSCADILGGKVSEEAIRRAIEKAKASGTAVRMDAALDDEEKALREAIEKRRLAEEARRSRLKAKAVYASRSVNPFDALDIEPVKERGWDSGKTLSEKQSALLMKQGINPDSMSYAQGRQVLNEMFRRWSGKLCTMKQAALLKRYGFETKNMTMQKASELITGLKSRNWNPVVKAPEPVR